MIIPHRFFVSTCPLIAFDPEEEAARLKLA
jgi:hypothetical protein